MRIKILLFLLAACFIADAAASDTFKLYLVRHAEKQLDGSPEPVLTDAGISRSQALAQWFADKEIQDIWSSDYVRTRDTAKPSVVQLGLDLNIYDAGKLADLAEKLLDKQHTAVIVGHSNTTPDLARLLCDCEIEDMDDSEYDRLIIVTVDDAKTQVETLQQGQFFQP
jgi:broad specificity phosphatase PhoE